MYQCACSHFVRAALCITLGFVTGRGLGGLSNGAKRNAKADQL
jgi:hypothetical protein